MIEPDQYIASGILESYVFGELNSKERLEVERMAAQHPEIRAELDEIEETQQRILEAGKIKPAPKTKASLFASLAALEAEEKKQDPPFVTELSKIEDYTSWIEKAGEPPAGYDNLHFELVYDSPGHWLSVVWVKDETPAEMHVRVLEKILILEGSCQIDMEGEVFELKAGDYLSVPLHHSHIVKVTSDIPCKFLLQKIAA